METQVQPPESVDATTTSDKTTIAVSEAETLSTLASETQSDNQVSEIGRKISDFLDKLPEYVVRFFNEYKLPIISFGLLIVLLTGLRILLAITNAINGIPFLAPIFEFIGFSYVIWFVFRYFLKASTRQELAREIDTVKKQIADTNS